MRDWAVAHVQDNLSWSVYLIGAYPGNDFKQNGDTLMSLSICEMNDGVT